MSVEMPFKLGTRGSVLAMAQAEEISSALRKAGFREGIEIVIVKTTGDRGEGSMNPGEGSFADEINRQVADGRLDGGIHSMKDVPVKLPDTLSIAVIPGRRSRLDCLVSRTYYTGFRPRSTVGTSSNRRIAQMLRTGIDIRPVSLRGNVTTRLAKVERGEVDAAVMAVCGLERIGYSGREHIGIHPLPLERFVPAAGQGALALITKEGRIDGTVVAAADSHAARRETMMERTILSRLGATCDSPLGVSAVSIGRSLHLRVQLLTRDGREERALSCLVREESEAEARLSIFEDDLSRSIIEGEK